MKIFWFLAILFLFSCNQENNQLSSSSAYSNSEEYGEMQLFDSIVFNSPMVEFSDYNKYNYLFFNRISGDIYIYNIRSKSMSQFNNFGKSGAEYGVMSDLMSFYKDSLVAVGKYKSIVLYNFEGDFINNISLKNRISSYPVRRIRAYKDSFIVYKNETYNPMWQELIDKRFVKLNYYSGVSSQFVDFPLEGIEFYKNKDYIYNGSISLVSTYANNCVYVSNRGVADLQVYSMDDLSFLKEIKLKLDYYSPIKISKEPMSPTLHALNYNFYARSDKKRIGVFNNYIFVIYSYSYTESEINKIIEESDGFKIREKLPYEKYALSIYKDDKKMGSDIKINPDYELVHVINPDTMLFKRQSSAEEDSLGITVFKIGKLLFNEK